MFNKFFLPIIDMCLSCEDKARQSCAMVPKWRFFLRPVFPASRVQHISFCTLNALPSLLDYKSSLRINKLSTK